jgi:hypothetical protein
MMAAAVSAATVEPAMVTAAVETTMVMGSAGIVMMMVMPVVRMMVAAGIGTAGIRAAGIAKDSGPKAALRGAARGFAAVPLGGAEKEHEKGNCSADDREDEDISDYVHKLSRLNFLLIHFQITPDALLLKMELTQCQNDNEGGKAQDDALIGWVTKQGDAKKRQIKRQQQAAEAQQGDEIRIKAPAILRVVIQQFFVSGLPDRNTV